MKRVAPKCVCVSISVGLWGDEIVHKVVLLVWILFRQSPPLTATQTSQVNDAYLDLMKLEDDDDDDEDDNNNKPNGGRLELVEKKRERFAFTFTLRLISPLKLPLPLLLETHSLCAGQF